MDVKTDVKDFNCNRIYIYIFSYKNDLKLESIINLIIRNKIISDFSPRKFIIESCQKRTNI